ncbi:MAG: GreA/GreB family elongation factor [Verrucomicrobia bacterium]|jgi:transcription elongation GreA/GreB family factor|nr:GreA/GreB family elongation factor [Verrucomicrobiota bacterium]MDA0905199.1 GreA/GreB family elongation factor [Verrucomicrobiota bacterium]MDA1077458.1 GreA/GreB family elongation factor [Verrucomicrobiota bacterium]
MNTEVIDRLVEKDPSLESSRTVLESMNPGTYCIHRSWGFGVISGFDEDRGMILIDFEDDERTSHAMDPVFCLDKLELLPDESILAQHRKNTDEIDQLAKKEPAELIIKILEQGVDGCMTSREIERILNYMFGSSKAKRWWTATKKVLVKDPRIAVPNKKNEPYVLRDEPVKPEQEILQDFFEEKRSYEKIVLAEKLFDLAAEKEDLQADLPQVLADLTVAIMEAKNLSQADRLYGIWVRNNLARDVEEDVEKLEPTSASILKECEDDLAALADLMPAKFHSRFLDLVARTYPDNWKEIILNLLQNTTVKFSGECAHFLIDREESKLLIKSLNTCLDEQSLKAPVLLWMLKFRGLSKFKDLLGDMINPRLLTAVFSAIDYESLKNATSRRIPLAEILSDDRELLSDILSKGSEENGKDLAQALLLNPGFEDLTKRSLLARFIKKFPVIQSILDGERAGSSSMSTSSVTDDTLIVSKGSYDRKLADLDLITKEKIPANSQAIEAARELGDLKENAEYHMAKDDQKVLLARQAELQADLMRAKATDFTEAPSDSVGIGTIVDLKDSNSGDKIKYTILGAWDGDPENNILSYLTPLAQNILGKKVGEVVEIDIQGYEQTLVIEGVSRWVDQK